MLEKIEKSCGATVRYATNVHRWHVEDFFKKSKFW
jgi:hypothetical protein